MTSEGGSEGEDMKTEWRFGFQSKKFHCFMQEVGPLDLPQAWMQC